MVIAILQLYIETHAKTNRYKGEIQLVNENLNMYAVRLEDGTLTLNPNPPTKNDERFLVCIGKKAIKKADKTLKKWLKNNK